MSESTLLNQLSGNRHSFNGLSLILSERYACHLNQAQVYERLNALWQGQKVNFTEEKRALLVAQRQFKQGGNNITDVNKFFQAQDDKMLSLVEAYEGIKNIICVGVGGSSWGLQCLNKAFKTTLLQKSKLIFIDHCDINILKNDLANIKCEETLVVYISKSGSTHEVVWAYQAINQIWDQYKRILITANSDAQSQFRVLDHETLWMHDEINGRMSIWSPVIFPILVAYGSHVLDEFRAGGCYMDRHMQQNVNSVFETLPGRLANAFLVQQNKFSQPTLWMLTYASLLDGFGPYVQQLMMESLGKPFNQKNERLAKVPGPMIMPMTGHQAQHAAMQYLHQSHEPFMLHALTLNQIDNESSNQHLCAQYKAMTDETDVLDLNMTHKFSVHQSFHSHNKQVSILSVDDVNPKRMGMLVAMYEYVTLIMGFHADINPFDQFGVERPKAIMKQEVFV
ncbi:MAG: hypothetical protein P8L77_04945 [Gammaproteobacteria bacterium]|nr:hypothetical protein [Gammaproteobacteria bacterium]